MAQEVEMATPTVATPPGSDAGRDPPREGNKGSWWADNLLDPLLDRLKKQEETAADQKEEYAEKLEKADQNRDMFKYFLLINVASLEKYVAQTRIQAQLSFRLCKT